MPRIAQPTDFTVQVDGVGSFAFGKRTMRDEIAIQVEYARIIDGVEPTAWLATVGGWLASLRVLTVRAPADWDVDDMDPLDPATYEKLGRVHEALKEQERSFRRQPGVSGAAGGAGAV